MPNEPIRILLVDRHSLTREAIGTALDGEEALDVVGFAAEPQEAVAKARILQPDVTLVQLNASEADTLAVIRGVCETVPGSGVIVVSSAEDAQELFDAVDAGATGFITREAPMASLVEAIRAVARDETVIPARLLGGLLDRLVSRSPAETRERRRLASLTRRERQVLALLAQGATNDAIARELMISPQTARTHIQNILPKLGVRSRLEAVTFVTRHRVDEQLQEVDA